MTQSDVLVVGAGPTGLVLGLWLTKLGVKVAIIDKTAEPSTTSRALAVQARTRELYRQLDLTDDIVVKGHRVPAVNLWVKGEQAARIPYPFLHIFPQDQHERLLTERLETLGGAVERRTRWPRPLLRRSRHQSCVALAEPGLIFNRPARSRWSGSAGR